MLLKPQVPMYMQLYTTHASQTSSSYVHAAIHHTCFTCMLCPKLHANISYIDSKHAFMQTSKLLRLRSINYMCSYLIQLNVTDVHSQLELIIAI